MAKSRLNTDFEAVLPVYVLGDSHALPYRNLAFREHWTGRWVTTRAKYISGLAAHDFFKPDTEEFHPELIAFLEYEGLVRDGQATHVSREETDFAIAKASGAPVVPPILLFTLGDIDIRAFLMSLLRDEYDFVPPFETSIPLSDRQLVPWDAIDEVMAERMAPFVAGLRELRECGFNRLYVQNVVPPTRNEARIKELHGYKCPVSVRTKLVMAFNKRLAEECQSIGVTVIDNWGEWIEGSFLRADLELDGVHLPPAAAVRHLELVLDHAINCQWFAANHVRYELYYHLACGAALFPATAGASGDHEAGTPR